MKSNFTKMLTVVIGLALLGTIAAWQFYQFVIFKDGSGAADAQGGRIHLWVAMTIAFATAISGVFFISKFLRYDLRNEMHIIPQGHPLGVGRSSQGRS